MYSKRHTSAWLRGESAKGVRRGARRREHLHTSRSGAVDDEFWALICEDEDWLDREFAAIVSEAESPTVPPRRLMV